MITRTLVILFFSILSFSVNSQSIQEEVKKAEGLSLDGNHEQALIILNKILSKDSTNYNALVVRGMVYNTLDDIQKSYDDLCKAIKISPDSGRAYFYRGLVLFRSQYSDEAIYDYTRALELADNDSVRLTIYSNRGTAKQQKRDFQGGYEDYSRAFSLDTTNLDIINNLGTVLDELGRGEESIEFFKKIIRVNPKYIGGWVNLGFQHNKIGKYVEALEYFNEALKLESNNPLALNNRGYTKYMLKDYKSALEDINASLEVYPANSYAFKNRALVYIALREKAKACEDIDQALKLEFTKVWGDEVLTLQKANCQ